MNKIWKKNRHKKGRGCLVLAGVLILVIFRANVVLGEESPDLELHAGGAVLMDGYSGRVLYEKNGNLVLPMASTTKIMTCIVALENGDLQELAEVSAYAASMPDVQLGINKGEKYRLGDLLLSLMLESHNDSAVAIAEYIGAKSAAENVRTEASERTVEESKALVSVFAELMNQKAAEIGCEHTFFITPNGLDAVTTLENENGELVEHAHSTTAEELALIMRYCVSQSEKSDEFVELTRTRKACISDETKKRSFSCVNHNRYLDMTEGVISGKTGFTGKAGYCYVGAVNREGVFLIAALLACGWPPAKNLKWQDMNTLINYGMDNYTCVQVSESPEICSDYLVPEKEGKREKLLKVQTRIAFEPFSILLKQGESLSGSWYVEPGSVGKGEIAGAYQVRIGDAVCRSFPVTVWKTGEWNRK